MKQPQQMDIIDRCNNVLQKYAECKTRLLSKDGCQIADCDECPYDLPISVMGACDDILAFAKLEL